MLIANDFRRADADESATRPAMASLPKRSEKGTGREQNPHEFYPLKLGGYTSGATSVNSIE